MLTNIRDFIPDISSKINHSYSKASLEEVEDLKINDQAINRKYVEGITIDGIESKDLDDGIWAEERKDGGYTIWVSIADVAEIVKEFSYLDADGLDKATSIYLRSHTIHMFPEKISTDICSLNGKQKTLTITTQIDLDNEFNVLNTQIYESIFFNINRFNYEDFGKQYLNTDSDFFSQLHLQSKIARGLYKKRLGKGIITNFRDDDIISKGDYKAGNTKHIASLTVQEFMILTNIVSTIEDIKEKVTTISRNHMPDFEGKKIPKELERAYYDSKAKYHLGLQEKYYGHNTSPIRRYADLINQRQRKSFMRNELPIYSNNDIILLCEYINMQITAIRLLQKEHDYLVKTTKKIRKQKKELEENSKKVKEYKPMIQRINHSMENEYRVPNIIIDEILKITQERNGILPDWVLKIFLTSNETKFKIKMKEIILKDPRAKRYLGIIGCIPGIKIEEKEIIEDGKGKKVFKVIYKGNIIFNKSSKEKDIENNKSLSRITYRLRKEALKKILDYFINN